MVTVQKEGEKKGTFRELKVYSHKFYDTIRLDSVR